MTYIYNLPAMSILWEGLKFLPCIIAELQQKVIFSFHYLNSSATLRVPASIDRITRHVMLMVACSDVKI